MLLLLLFALVAGAGTALSPCVLPILPAVLGAGVTGGRRRPFGIVVGLTLSFALSAVALVYLIDALGLPNDIQRIVAIVVLLVFGVVLLIPPVSDRLEAWVSRVVGAPRMERSEGFGGGLVLGGALGLAYFPCAGPILAGVITVSAAQDFTVGRLAVALAYAIGSGIVLYAIMRLGRRFTDRLKPIQGRIQMAMGAVMVVVAIAMTANLDTKFQNAIANDLPDFLVNPTESLEQSDAVASELAEVRGGGHEIAAEGGGEQALAGRKLPVIGPSGEFTDTQEWFNTPDGQPLSIADLNAQGKTVLVDFWTYTCINCIRTLPYVKAWADKYEQDGLVVVGVHSPEFPFEKDAGNVADAIASNDIQYPVVQDNDLGTWNSFHNQYWPAKYLIDPDGNVRYSHFGEGDYDQTEQAIRSVLAENGAADLGGEAKAKVEVADPDLATPETYLGSARAAGWVNGQPPQGTLPTGSHDFGSVGDRVLKALPPNGFAYQGRWDIGPEDATAAGDSRIDVRFRAAGVYLVLGSPDREREVEVFLDGKPISAADAGSDVGADGTVTVGDQRLYRLVQLDEAADHVLSLEFENGISGYAFTFG
jgi:cytochrome c biogenesis protein CcdA/thiol-disulfide isomerase/thioredoxin